jgi:siderophore synthetase component/RimJ/RimL family protein N-acetyltransferase
MPVHIEQLAGTASAQNLTSVNSEGGFSFRRLCLPGDIDVLHRWFGEPRAHFWGMRDKTAAELERFYEALLDSGHACAYLGMHGGAPAFLIECYESAHDEVAEHYTVEPGDLGMHVFIAPAMRPVHGHTRDVFAAAMTFMFDTLGALRVVVEPDIDNKKIHVLNRAVGFVYTKIAAFRAKTASLAFCTRQDFYLAVQQGIHQQGNAPMSSLTLSAPAKASAHLTPEVWRTVNRLLVRKAIAEYAHELIVVPERTDEMRAPGMDRYRLVSDDGQTRYTFDARLFALRHWSIPPDSIEADRNGTIRELDALEFIIDFRQRLGISEALLPIYLEEISSTLYGSAFKHVKQAPGSAALVDADFQTIETSMMEGHPGFVANNGRLGFDAIDYAAYAPESGAPIALVWLAVHRDQAAFACASDLDYERLIDEELGAATIARFTAAVSARGRDVADYYFMPAHPWQWFNKLSITFSSYIANDRIICLGLGEDRYRAQQSIRTLFNQSDSRKRYTKTSLSILNMGFMRGLSPYYMAATPAINDWIKALVERDPYLQRNGFTILREVASIGFRNHYFEKAIEADSPYKKMFSALWRESPLDLLKPGERLMTMTALLHVDRHGEALLPALITASGLDTQAWLERYVEAYLAPLVHCFYAYDLVFMPHGENLILVLDAHVPVRVIMKDIAEEAVILDKHAALPEGIRRIAVDVPDPLKLLAIFIDVFDGFFRFMNPILVEQGHCTEELFWSVVARCIATYQREHPQYAARFAQYDLFAAEFTHSCLNRLQLGNPLQMVNLADPAANLKLADMLCNPLAPLRPVEHGAPV